MARLILATAEGPQAIDLRPANSLGRHPNNSIQLLDKIVSKEHCIVELREGQFLLRDLGSLNGTYINGERVRGEQFLRHGDEIALGSTRARYDDGTAPLNFAPLAAGPGAVQHAQPHFVQTAQGNGPGGQAAAQPRPMGPSAGPPGSPGGPPNPAPWNPGPAAPPPGMNQRPGPAYGFGVNAPSPAALPNAGVMPGAPPPREHHTVPLDQRP